MYQIELLRFGSGADVMIYDQSQMNELSVVSPRLSLEISEAGSLSFTLPITHPQISELWPLQSFLKVYDDGTEKFYGRILQRSHPTLLGQISFECEGDLSFLLDSEITPYGKDSSGNQITQNLTAEAFFRWCIDQHNADVGNDPRRTFTVGIVNADKRNSTNEYSIASYTQTKSAIESNILDIYGGFLRTRPKPGGGRYIDWIENYDAVNPQSITIGTNMEEQTNEFDANDLFTVIRPVGNDGITITPIDLFPAADMAKYGRIVKSVSFNDADTTADLQAKAQEYKDRMQATLFVSSSIRLVDMHYQDGSVPKLWIGDRFTNIHGLEGSEMVASSLEIDFEAPQNDNLSLKNRRSLDPDLTAEGNRHRSKSFSKSSGKSNAKAAQYFKTLKETGMDLEISAENVWMHGKTLTQNYEEIRQTMDYFESVSSRANQSSQILDQQTQRINNHDVIVRPIEGTAIVKDPYFIANVAGSFEIWEDQTTGKKSVHLIDGAEFLVDDENGIVQNVGTRLNIAYNKSTSLDEFFTAETYEGGTTWTMKNKLAGIVGMYRIETEQVPDPDHPGQTKEKRNLVFIEGGGYKIERNGVEYGLYHEGNLTGGIMAQMINGQVETQIRGDKVKIWSTSSLDDLVGHWEEYSIRDVDENGNVTFHKGLKYIADAGMRIRRTDDNTGITNEWGVYDEGNLTGGVMVQKINGQATTYIRGDKILIGNVAGNDLDSWAADADVAIAGKVAMQTFSALEGEVNNLKTQKLSTTSLKSAISDLDLVNVQAIASAAGYPNAYASLSKFQGNNFVVNVGSAAGQTLTRDLVDGVYDLQIVGPSGNSNTYTLQKKAIKDGTWTDVGTFSRATELTGAWNGGDLEVSASPQGNKYTIHFPVTESTNSNSITIEPTKKNGVPGVRTYIMDTDGNNACILKTANPNGNGYVTVAKVTHGKYNAGWGAAYDKVNVDGYFPTTQPSSIPQSIYTAKVNSAVDGNRVNYQYYVTADSQYAYIRYGSTSGPIVARVQHNQYSSGWTAAYDKVNVDGYFPTTQPSSIPQSIYTAKVNSAVDGNRVNYQYYVTADSQYAYIRYGSTSGPIVARVQHNQFRTGYNTCINSIQITSSPAISGTLAYNTHYYVYAKYDHPDTGDPTSAKQISFNTPADRYGTGYDDCAGTITTDSTPSGTLPYGTTYTINVQYTNRSSGNKVTAKQISFRTPSDNSSTYDTTRTFYYWYQENFVDAAGYNHTMQIYYTINTTHPSEDYGYEAHFNKNDTVKCPTKWT